jgi:DUF2975 family protein
MNRGSTVFLRAVLVLIGIGALAFLLGEPHLEGRNAHATPFEIYFKDPFLAYIYVGSIPFFVGLWHAFKVLGDVGGDRQFSPASVRSLRTIKICAIAFIAFVAGAELLILTAPGDEDRAGGVAIGIVLTLASIVVATAMSVLERSLQRVVDMKSENDLTV